MAQQNLDFNIVAHTKGMEAIATLINRVGALEAETKRLASANQQLSASTDTVIRNGVRYNNAMDAQSKQLRQNRQGTQQLGMQMNDFATSVSSGTSVQQAFAQQLGQVGYAMSQMEGTAGKVGGFLAGPWGGMIVIASLALATLIEKLSGAAKETDNLFDASKGYTVQATKQELANSSLVEITDALNRISGRYTETLDQEANAAIVVAKAKIKEAQARLVAAKAQMAENAAAAENFKLSSQAMRMGIGEPGARAAAGAAGALAGGFELATRSMEGEVKKQESLVANAEAALNYLINNGPRREGGANERGRGGASDAANAARKIKKDQEEAAKYITDVNIKADKEWREYWAKAEEDQMVGLQQKLADMQTMASATIETVGQSAGKIFLDRAMEIQNAFGNIGLAVNDAFKGMLTGAMSWKDGIKGIIQSVINELWRLYVVQQIVGFVTKAIGGVTGNPGPNLDMGITVTRGRAIGGYVAAQTPYMVGEKGPELFVPGGSGTIIPNKNMGMGGGGGGVTVNVDARGSADPAAVRAQVEAGILQAAPAIIAAAEARTVQGLRRPRLGGAMK